jgi:hypothetical protein
VCVHVIPHSALAGENDIDLLRAANQHDYASLLCRLHRKSYVQPRPFRDVSTCRQRVECLTCKSSEAAFWSPPPVGCCLGE